jgi:hypothetical protein
MLTILSWGGIGDTLRNISLVPHQFLYRKFGIQCRVVHKHWKKVGCLEHAEAPEPSFFQELVNRCPSLVWGDEVDDHRGTGQVLNRGLRDVLKIIHCGSPRYYPFDIQLTQEERGNLPIAPGSFNVGIQTHLTGMKTKQWGIENWRHYLDALVAADRDLSLILLDVAPQVDALCFNDRVRNTRNLNICQSIELCRSFDLLVSVDSWSKYVAAWNHIHQIIVVPDQRAEYPSLNPRKLVRDEFAGIFNHPSNLIIGLTETIREPQLTLKDISELSPDFLAEQTLAWIQKIKNCRNLASIGRL